MTSPSEFRSPRIRIVSTGTEILQGHYPDTNAQWLSREFMGVGFAVERHVAIPDANEPLRAELGRMAGECDLIVMTGGLGPTADDLNRQVVADVFSAPLREDADSLRFIEAMFASRGREMPAGNAVQALIPEGATILQNPRGTAPGFFLPPRDGRAGLLALPGPPREMQPMFKETALALVLERFASGRRALRTLTLHTASLAESHINDRIADLFGSDERVNVALLAGKWRVDVRLTLQAGSDAENDDLAAEWRGRIAERIGGENVWGEDDTGFEEAVQNLLRARGETLATAESCTGGLIAKRLTDVPGSSEVFLEGFVTYSNAAKVARLGVPAELMAEHGAVSAEVAGAMAVGAKAATGASWALATTGIAGPSGGSPEKPVGLVWFGLASPDGQVKTKRIVGPRQRDAVRELGAITALDILRRAILRTG